MKLLRRILRVILKTAVVLVVLAFLGFWTIRFVTWKGNIQTYYHEIELDDGPYVFWDGDSTARVMNLLDTETQIIDGHESLPVATVRGEVTFETVSFEYGDHDLPVIKELSLHVPAGETIAIVGATGSGKTTLVKLLLRFYDVQSGRICLDGHNIRTLRLADLRVALEGDRTISSRNAPTPRSIRTPGSSDFSWAMSLIAFVRSWNAPN